MAVYATERNFNLVLSQIAGSINFARERVVFVFCDKECISHGQKHEDCLENNPHRCRCCKIDEFEKKFKIMKIKGGIVNAN